MPCVGRPCRSGGGQTIARKTEWAEFLHSLDPLRSRIDAEATAANSHDHAVSNIRNVPLPISFEVGTELANHLALWPVRGSARCKFRPSPSRRFAEIASNLCWRLGPALAHGDAACRSGFVDPAILTACDRNQRKTDSERQGPGLHHLSPNPDASLAILGPHPIADPRRVCSREAHLVRIPRRVLPLQVQVAIPQVELA